MREKNVFKISGTVWRYPGAGGWHFVTLPEKVSVQIRNSLRGQRPWGYVKVKVTIGKTSWQTGLWPKAKEKVYLLVIKAEVRKKERILEGEKVHGILSLL